MTINLTSGELREFAKLCRKHRTLSEKQTEQWWEFAWKIDQLQMFSWDQHCASTLALALADAMERVEQLTNEARLANNAVGSHANEIVMLSAKINDLKTVLKMAYSAMAEPHGDWKDIREAKSLIEIRAMLGGDPK